MAELYIDQLNLSIRTKNALKRAGYMTLHQIMNLSEAELKQIRSLGAKSVDEVLRQRFSITGMILPASLRRKCFRFFNRML